MGGSFARSVTPQTLSSATYNAANQQLNFGGQPLQISSESLSILDWGELGVGTSFENSEGSDFLGEVILPFKGVPRRD